ncbi:MAG: Vitamin B12 dependent methionine synthase activation subunit [Lachnospiraceae bacterium]|nr:Vitamin B12 dependent methionine synthase activation subunit [Lachnospiraceae bacterium]
MSVTSPILVRTYDPKECPQLSAINMDEVMRYGGMMISRTPVPPDTRDESVGEVRALIDECASEVLPMLAYKVCYRHIDVTWDGDSPVLPFDSHRSRNLAHNLEGCTAGVMFAATIGVGIDRLITRYNHSSPSKALILQALGAERVEALCDLFNAQIEEEAVAKGMSLRPRFSPGYGDLPLTVQKDFMTLLDCAHLIGINLNESLLMSPSKSVTAIIGMK